MNRLVNYGRGLVLLGLVLLMAAASSGALHGLFRPTQTGPQVVNAASLRGDRSAVARTLARAGSPVQGVAAQDNDDDDSSDNDSSDNSDNDSSDNDSVSASAVDDNDSSDNSDNDSSDSSDNDSSSATSNPDEDIVIENVSPSAAPPSAAPAPAPAGATATEASGRSTGGDLAIALPDNRVVVTVFPSMPAGITLTVRLIDPRTAPAAPGTRVGDLIFVLEARDRTGATLTTLPAEVNLDVTYTPRDVAGLNDQTVTLSWLDPADNAWKTAPKLVANPAGSTVAASVTQLGTYVVSVR